MKKLLVCGIAICSLALATGAQAQEAGVDLGGPVDAPKTMVVGAHIDMGMAHLISNDDDFNDEAKFRFAGGGGAYFDFYVIPMLAIEGGIGFVGKGVRFKDEDEMGNEWDFRYQLIYMEIPLGAKLSIMNFQASLLFSINFALAGKSKMSVNDNTEEHKWEDDDWDHWKRANIGPRIVLGYAIPIGPVSIVPGVYWSMHFLDEGKDRPDGDDDQLRAMNIMFRVAGEFGF